MRKSAFSTVLLGGIATAFLISGQAAFAGSNLISWWKLDEGSGSTAYDSAGDNDGTITGATWFDDPCRGMCLSFDGSSDYVTVGDKSNLEQQEFTLSFWGRLNNPSGSLQGGIAKGWIFGSTTAFSYTVDFDGGNARAAITNTSDTGFGITCPIADANWHMWSMTVGGGTLTLYRDGVFVNSTGYTGTIDYTKGNNNFMIGARSNGDYAFNGKIDYVRFYNRALSAGEIGQLYREGLGDIASEPNPANGAIGVGPNTVLSWSPGKDAASHDVYLGTDYNDVNDADTLSPEYKGNFDVNSYDPCGLELMTTYYWRIDEVNEPNLWKGGVWSFETAGPVIGLSATQFQFTAPEGGANPNVQILGISNSGIGTLNWQISEGCGWLSVEPNNGSSTGETDNVNLSVDISGLTGGIYTCNLTISDGNAANSPQIVSISLIVTGPEIGLSATQFQFTAIEGGANPNVQILSISNSGIGILNWRISEDCNWLSVEPNSGSSTGEADDVNLSVDISGLAAGIYVCNLTISDPNAFNNPQMAGITLHVRDADGILYVPSEYSTIQAAIGVALDGDTVIVAPGTYTGAGNYDLDFGGKAITVRSTDPEDPSVVTATVINCEGTGYGGFYFHSAEGPNSVVAGFTIKRGAWSSGGAIFCDGSSPTIKNCNITDNYPLEYGGGMYNTHSNPTLVNCTFSNNGVYYGSGGGMYNTYSNPTLVNCTFTDNKTEYGFGGGMYNYDSSPILTNCTFSSNSAKYHYGGGMYNFVSSPTLVNCRFSGNWAEYKYGGGMFNDASSPTLANCTFSDNEADYGGGMYDSDSSPILVDCILWGNTAPYGPQIYNSGTSSPVISFSDVQGGYEGTGNIDANPCFVTGPDGDYYLSQIAAGQAVDSPCVNAGSDTAANSGMDVFTTRTDEVGDEGIVDMGYHYPEALGSADINENWYVDFVDFAILSADWLECSNPYDSNCTETGLPDGDITLDYYVNIYDLEFFAECWLDCLVKPARNPHPAGGVLGVDPNVILRWSAGDGALEHDVYLGTDANAVAEANYLSAEFMGTVLDASFDPCSLDANTTYFWRIDETGPRCTTKGDVWNFKTWSSKFDPNSNLISLWKFDEGGGNTAYDSASNNDGTITGPAWFDDPCRGMCLSFDGVGDYVLVGDKSNLEQQEFTLSFWAKLNNPSGSLQGGIAKGWIFGSVTAFSYTLDFDGGNARAAITNTSNTGFGITGPIGGSSWHIWSMTVGGGTLTLYKDGAFVNSIGYTGTIDYTKSNNNFVIGARSNGDYAFNGKIDDVRFYNRALSAGEIWQLYQEGL